MPHVDLMDEDTLGPEAGPLMRARLHCRRGKRRLRQGKISAMTRFGVMPFDEAELPAEDPSTV